MSKSEPIYWWDFEDDDTIVVKSDQESGERLAVFKRKPHEDYMDDQIEEAEALIERYKKREIV